MSIHDLSAQLAEAGVQHRIVLAFDRPIVVSTKSILQHLKSAIKAAQLKNVKLEDVPDAGTYKHGKQEGFNISAIVSYRDGLVYTDKVGNQIHDTAITLELNAPTGKKLQYRTLIENGVDGFTTNSGRIAYTGDAIRACISRIIVMMQALDKAGKPIDEVDASEADAAGIHFSTTSERLKQRKEAKLYRQRNKSKLKIKAKKYAKLMKHKKPNLQRSRIAKLVAKHYAHRS